MLISKRLKIARAMAARDWRENKEARVIRNPRLAEEYNRVYGDLYAEEQRLTGLMYAS